MKAILKRIVSPRAWAVARYWYHWILDVPNMAVFLLKRHEQAVFHQKLVLLWKFFRIDRNIDCAHTTSEILYFVDAILDAPLGLAGDFAECGCFKGGSTAKFSLACRIAGRRLIVFDSFEGIPENAETNHATISGEHVSFPRGSYLGTLDEVKANIQANGELDICEFVKGYFDNTLPQRSDVLAGIYLDVDLASSTRTCLKHLYPRLCAGGWLMSQDGHLNLVLAEFKDKALWEGELGTTVPNPIGFGVKKLIRMQKPG